MRSDQALRMEADGGAPVNVAMITLARESRSLTQSELAGRLQVSQGVVSKLENGILPVSSEVVERLSEVLDYPPHFFSQTDAIYGAGVGELYHRRQEVPKKILATVHAQINIRRFHVERLLRSVDVPLRIQRLDIDEYHGDPEEVARAVRASWLLPSGPVKSVCRVLEDAGAVIVPFDFETAKIDGMSVWPPRTHPIFFINQRAPIDRLRLTLCHELGHVIMHAVPHPNIEKEATRFSAEFLMPADEIGSMLYDLNLAKLASLKRYWRTSMQAILVRASDLGRIGKGQAQYLWRQISRLGYRQHEPVELDPNDEQPSLLKELIEVHRDQLGYSIRELSYLLAAPEHETAFRYLGAGPHLHLA